MSSNAIDCSAIEQRLDEHNLYISTTQDQINKLNQNDPDVHNKREALTRKLNALNEQLEILQRALDDCRQGKGANFLPADTFSEGETL